MNTQTQQPIHDLEGKVALVTGAASGIGLATAQLLEARGARVVAEDINPLVNDMFRGQERIVPFVGDVATESAAQNAVALTIERFGRLDILVKNAASIVYKNAVDMTLDEWNSILGISSTGVFLHSREALKVMIPNQTGAIVNIGSYAWFRYRSMANRRAGGRPEALIAVPEILRKVSPATSCRLMAVLLARG
jgi:NAD(P)-dependent dehydrogenase (short-subunit alcohol dehydrogenase family)